MALWNEGDDDYLDSKRDKWGVQMDWGARGGPQAFGKMDHYVRKNRSWFRGKKTVKGSGEYKLNDADQFREWRSKYKGSTQKGDLMRAFLQDGGGGKQTGGANNYSQMLAGYMNRGGEQARDLPVKLMNRGGGRPGNYGDGYGYAGNDGEPESDEAKAARLAREEEQRLQAADDKGSRKRRDWWSRETSGGERGSVRLAMYKNKKAGEQAYRDHESRLASGWGHPSGVLA